MKVAKLTPEQQEIAKTLILSLEVNCDYCEETPGKRVFNDGSSQPCRECNGTARQSSRTGRDLLDFIQTYLHIDVRFQGEPLHKMRPII